MKKLALALVCFASVAFMASCVKTVEHPEPSIQVCTNEGYVQDGAVVDLNTDIVFGFVMASNTQTNKELATLVVTVDDTQWANVTLSGTSYTYTDTVFYSISKNNIVGSSVINAVVTDAAGETATATINLSVNQPAIDLEIEPISWIKTGHNAQDLSAYGLFWKETNYKSPFTHILPAEGSTLYLVENGDQDFANIVTDVDLNNYYIHLTETGRPIDDYKNVDCNASKDYHDLLIVKEANGKLHAINITRADITTPAAGTRITITGKAK